jgi:hypothetical protein
MRHNLMRTLILLALLSSVGSGQESAPVRVLDLQSASPRAGVILFDGDVRAWRFTSIPVSVEPSPTPTPIPDPPGPPKPPPPAPVPVVDGKLWVSYLTDAAAVTPSQAAIRSNADLRTTLSGLDATFRAYQSDEVEFGTLRFGGWVSKFPAVVYQDAKGKVLAVESTEDAAMILARVRQFRGVK